MDYANSSSSSSLVCRYLFLLRSKASAFLRCIITIVYSASTLPKFPKVIFVFSSPILGALPFHSRRVSFTDSEGIELFHPGAVERLFEAAVEAMGAFKQSVLTEMMLTPGTRVTIPAKMPEAAHTVTFAKVLSWLEGSATSPRKQVKKNRLRERLGNDGNAKQLTSRAGLARGLRGSDFGRLSGSAGRYRKF
jgi:hypothetical protein